MLLRLTAATAALLFCVQAAALPRESRVPGGIALLPLPADSADSISATLDGKPVFVTRNTDGSRTLVVGIPLTATPGPLALLLRNGNATQEIRLDVVAKDYPEQRITLPTQQHVTPSDENLARYAREAKEQTAVYKAFREQSMSWPAFIQPVAGPYSSPFGLKRFFNGEPRAPHAGLDIAAPEGRPVQSPAAGVVAQTGDYFFNGRTVMIDHGNGLVSMLCHLSEIAVKKGQVLKPGDIIGKVGKTGRATGPHLHWTVSLNDARIDPLLLLPARAE
ncbi:MAG: peptidoglycan DD-metalloendopeptidase family protein [Moraxellaceae bacterium]|nr:peptidoglycan DD-metalloendopeptidase family protein [Moraxellaceae bacterium]